MLFLLSCTLFTSAFLLFCCQPMVAKMILPVLGGNSSVWTTCVVFFQTMLLTGYVYAHCLGKLARVRDQMLLHISLMSLALLFLPIDFGAVPANASEAPVTWILRQLLVSVGFPFAVVSATAPLLQNWLSRTPQAAGRDPYFLYATSNAGSLLALAAYPALIEPRFGVGAQSVLWFSAYGFLIVMFVSGAWVVWNECRNVKPRAAAAEHRTAGIGPGWKLRAEWLAAAFVPSALMLAVTNHITMNVGSFPFLWIVPLAVYLLTFVTAFARRVRLPAVIVSAAATGALLLLFPVAAAGAPVHSTKVWLVLGCHVSILFFGALLCHTNLADARPATKRLTEFYFVVALGGVLGGMFTAIIAPVIFNTVFEYPLLVAAIMFFRKSSEPTQRLTAWDAAGLGLFAAFLAGVFTLIDSSGVDVTIFRLSWHSLREDLMDRNNVVVLVTGLALALSTLLFRKRTLQFAIAFSLLVMGYAAILPRKFEDAARVDVSRDFFGVKKVLYEQDIHMRKLVHGDTLHGRESLDAALAGEPLSYYHKTGPIGDVMELIGGRTDQRVGVVGLGTGSVAAYGGPNRHITFFEIDPQVADIAQRFFTFLSRCGNSCDVVIGDGRLSLQRRADAEFDLLVLDAFSSDSIPGHLLSREAVRVYMSKLKPDGILMFHVSNRYLDVEKLAVAVVSAEGIAAFVRYDRDEGPPGKSSSQYVIALRLPESLTTIPNRAEWAPVENPSGIRAWTDDFSNMLSIVKSPL